MKIISKRKEKNVFKKFTKITKTKLYLKNVEKSGFNH